MGMGVLSGFRKDVPKEEILNYSKPYANGYPGFWKPELSMQHPLATVELVAWDSVCTLIFSREEQIVRAFMAAFPLSEDLKEYNSRFAGLQ